MVGITRFPRLALDKFKKEEDSAKWIKRLSIHGIDLRSTSKLVEFLDEFKRKHKRVDIIINNAAQTIHRPPGYYKDLLAEESYLLSIENETLKEEEKALSISDSRITMQMQALSSAKATQIPIIPADSEPHEQYFPTNKKDAAGEPLDARDKTTWNSKIGEVHYGEVLETQLVNVVAPFTIINELAPLLRKRHVVYGRPESDAPDLKSDDGLDDQSKEKEKEDEGEGEGEEDDGEWDFSQEEGYFQNYKESYEGKMPDPGPPLEPINNWRELFDWPNAYEGIPSANNEFWQRTSGRRHKIVVNVTSPEGQFMANQDNTTQTTQKKGYHPHTDMAKAALNMLTCSVANDLAKHECYVFSVDTGWFSDMRPFYSSPVSVPLSATDAAARVLQPVFDKICPFVRVADGDYGYLLRNYQRTNW